MDDRVTTGVLKRLAALEDSAVRLRIGEVTDDSPLSVVLGAAGAEFAHNDVKALDSVTPTIGDLVAVLVRDHDLLVIGVLS